MHSFSLQKKREDAAVHLAQAMHKSQGTCNGAKIPGNGAVPAKRTSGTLRGCSPLTVSLLSVLPVACGIYYHPHLGQNTD